MPEDTEVQELPEVDAAPAEEQAETPSESATDDTAPKPEAPKQDDRLQKRIDKLTRDREEARRDRDYWRTQATAPKPEMPAAPTKPQPDGKPKVDDFENADEYVEALTDWKIEQRQKQDRDAKRTVEERTQAEARAKTVSESIASARQELPDFDEVMEEANIPNNANTPLVIHELQGSADGAKLLYHIVKDEAQMQKLFALDSPAKIARELGRIEARIASSAPAKPQAPPTNTPAPIKPVAASRQAVAAHSSADDDTEWLRKRRAELAAKR